ESGPEAPDRCRPAAPVVASVGRVVFFVNVLIVRICPMRCRLALLAAFVLASAASAADDYKLGPDSVPQEGVPRGTVTNYSWNDSKVFPGTVRDYWVYVPAQYDKDRPACVMVFQDGGGYVSETGQFRVGIVFDNLIHRKEMPVTVGIFINPGNVP